MGMFDSVYIKCPTKNCRGVIEFQSKAGNCCLKVYRYPEETIPVCILESIKDDWSICSECHERFDFPKTDLLYPTINEKITSLENELRTLKDIINEARVNGKI
jgi:hypothetical protein